MPVFAAKVAKVSSYTLFSGALVRACIDGLKERVAEADRLGACRTGECPGLGGERSGGFRDGVVEGRPSLGVKTVRL